MRSHLWLLAASGHLASADWLFGQELDARGVVGLSWPRATDASTHDGANGWTPRPTDAPYVAGGTSALELARRRDQWVREKRAQTTANTWENAQTCGWRAGTESIPFTCADSFSCATNSDSVVACTSSGETADPFFTVCLDYQAFKNGACNSIGPKTGCCETASIGSCITYIWTGTAPRSMYRCYTAQAIITMLDEPQFSQTKSSSSSTSSSTSASTTSSSTTSSSAAESTSSTPAPASSGSSSNNTGAIVGGVVGGVAGIALIAGAVAWLVIRNRNKNRTPGAGTAYSAVAPGDTSYPGAGGAGPMPPSTYAPSSLSPHMSQAGYFPPSSSGAGPQPETPYMAGATPPVPGAYNPQAAYYDPAKLAEQQQLQQQYGGYAPYPGAAPAGGYPAGQHQVVSELDPTSVAPGHQSNPVEMAANPSAER